MNHTDQTNVKSDPEILKGGKIPGEGKTTQAIALTHNLSGLDKKVLLIEGDIRRRTLSQYIPQTPPGNLVSVLTGDQSLGEAIISDDRLNADVLMGAKSNVNAADLFSSDKFHDFVENVRNIYDFVIIDTPPVLVVPDARIIAHHCDAVIYSVNWDRTELPPEIRTLT